MSRLVFALALAIALGSARAEENPRARQAYLDAEAAYRLDHFEEAARLYEESYRLSKMPDILFDIAQSYRRWYDVDKNVEHLRRALDLYRSFLRDSPSAKQAPVAERFVAEIERTLADDTRRRREEQLARASGKEGLALAEQLVAARDLAGAGQVLDRILASHGNRRDLLVAALEKRALVAGALGEADLARTTFERALALDPGFLLPADAPETTREAFRKARQDAAGVPISIKHTPPGEVRRAEPVIFGVSVLHDKPGLVARVALHYRRAGEGAFVVAKIPNAPGQVVVEVPADYVSGPPGARFEYFVVALDKLDGELAFEGSPQGPFVFSIAEPVVAARAPRRWPIWVGVTLGILAAGAAVSTAVVLTRPQETVLAPWDLRGK